MTIKPYKHDCDRCKWVGWVNVGIVHGNMYICRHGKKRIEIIIRWSDDPPDYSCYSFNKDFDNQPSSITIVGKGEP